MSESIGKPTPYLPNNKTPTSHLAHTTSPHWPHPFARLSLPFGLSLST